MTINEKMNNAVINDNFNTIESIALNPKNAYVNVGKFNIFNGKFWREWEWVDISEVGKSYFDDLNGECQDYVMSLPKYKKLDYYTYKKSDFNPLKKKFKIKYVRNLHDLIYLRYSLILESK